MIYAVSVILLGYIYHHVLINAVEKHFIYERENQYLNQSNIIASLMSSEGYISKYHSKDENAIENMNKTINSKAKDGGYRVIIFDYNGFSIADSFGSALNKYYSFAELSLALNGNDNTNIYMNKDNLNYETIYSAASIVNENSEIRGAVLIVDDIGDLYDFVEQIRGKIWFIVVILIFLSLIIATAISSWFVNPIKKMLKVIEEMSDGHLNKRMNINSHDEFSELGEAFNHMAEKIEAVELRKDQFVSNVSHELKTPLSAIKVLSESTLHMDNLSKDTYDEFLTDIISEVDRMTEIINDLLTLVKLDQEESLLNIQKINSQTLMDNILNSLKSLYSEKKISIFTNYKTDIDFEADKLKIFSAISNIVENAIKYTPNCGTITIELKNDNNYVYFTIQDTGVGIEEKELDSIFTRFYRVDDSRNRETGGTGLGLSIAHSVILLHNGSIRVSSIVDEGSLFLVRLPLKYYSQKEDN